MKYTQTTSYGIQSLQLNELFFNIRIEHNFILETPMFTNYYKVPIHKYKYTNISVYHHISYYYNVL